MRQKVRHRKPYHLSKISLSGVMVFAYGENIGSHFLNLHQNPDIANLTNRQRSYNNFICPLHSAKPTANILTNKIGVGLPVIRTNINMRPIELGFLEKKRVAR